MKALIAMSGGVDSSTAAYLMQQSGYACAGCTMKLYTNEDAGLSGSEEGSAGKTCCSLDDTEDARSVAFRLGMPFYVFNYTDAFRCRIIREFAETYLRGELTTYSDATFVLYREMILRKKAEGENLVERIA